MPNKPLHELMESIDGKSIIKYLSLFLVSGAAISIYIVIIYFQHFNAGFSDKQDVWGQFGDFLGGTLNPIFGFCSFTALIFTLLLQIKQVELQKQELDNSKEELAASREELKKSNEMQKLSADALGKQCELVSYQAFESTFFQMLSLHSGIISQISCRSKQGIDAISEYYSDFREAATFDIGSAYDNKQELSSYVNRKFTIFFKFSSSTLSHYYRNLFQILHFIEQSNTDNKQFYFDVVKAQLSDDETLLLFYFGLREDAHQIKPLIEKAALLEHIPYKRIKRWQEEITLYDMAAYGNAPIDRSELRFEYTIFKK